MSAINIRTFILEAARRIYEDITAHPLITVRQATGFEFSHHRDEWVAIFRVIGVEALIRLATDLDVLRNGN